MNAREVDEHKKWTRTQTTNQGGGTNGSRALFDEQEAAGDPASNGIGNGPVTSSYMPGWTLWQYPADPSTRAPSTNGGVQALIDLKVSIHHRREW